MQSLNNPNSELNDGINDISSKYDRNRVYSVKAASLIIDRMFRENSTLQSIYIVGEVTGCKLHEKSGHTYFTLRDSNGGTEVLKAAIWAHNRPQIDIVNGLQVECVGDIKIYAAGSDYSLHVKKINITGAGALIAQRERLKEKLAGEGLFDDARKRAIPRIPNIIGLITAENSDAYKDIVTKQLQERFMGLVVVIPVAVQGKDCPRDVIHALRRMNSIAGMRRPEVIIIARGGGSFEDLWYFDDESMVRAIADSDIPVISAIGHENDCPLIDFVADFRAATPTDAGIKVSMSKNEILSNVERSRREISKIVGDAIHEKIIRLGEIQKKIASGDEILNSLVKRLNNCKDKMLYELRKLIHSKDIILAEKRKDIQYRCEQIFVSLDAISSKNESLRKDCKEYIHAFVKYLDSERNRIVQTMAGYNPKRPLSHGFAIIRDISNRKIDSVGEIAKMDLQSKITIEMSDGLISGKFIRDLD